MDLRRSAPGMKITFENGDVVCRIKRDQAVSLLSILLHSKFSDGPRMEFLSNPYVNALIEAMMVAADLSQKLAEREDMEIAMAPTIKLVEEWAAANDISGEEAASLLRLAVYPYCLD
jgi:hypothetical protein